MEKILLRGKHRRAVQAALEALMIGRTAICIPHRLSTGLTQRCEGTERSCILRAFVSLHVPTKQLSEFRQSINLSVRRLLLFVLLLLLFSRAEAKRA